MRTEPPPSRYRVVERGRRLEVVDTWDGGRPVAPLARPREDGGMRPRPPSGGPGPDGPPAKPSTGTTYAWIVLLIGWFSLASLFPVLWFLPLILLNRTIRHGLYRFMDLFGRR